MKPHTHTHTHIKNPSHTNCCLWFQHLTYSRWREPQKREVTMSFFYWRLFCSGLDRCTANMFYTRLEYLIPPVCEEGQLQNKVIVWDLGLKLLYIGRHVFDLSMAPEWNERKNSILIVSSFRFITVSYFQSGNGNDCNLSKWIHELFNFSMPWTSLSIPFKMHLEYQFPSCSAVYSDVIIGGLRAVQISAISVFLCCGIGKETVIWFLSDTLMGQIQVWTGTEETTVKFEGCWREGRC